MGTGDDGRISRRRVLAAVGVIGAGSFVQQVRPERRSRQEILAVVDPIARIFGKYTAYRLASEEFVGTASAENGEAELVESGYEANPLSAAKYHPETGAVDDRSLRRVDPDNPRWQWHVHLWTEDDATEVFSHYEYRPDFSPIGDESFAEMAQRVRVHYNPKWDMYHDDDEATYFLGRACHRVEETVIG